jgi:hypothetical protein
LSPVCARSRGLNATLRAGLAACAHVCSVGDAVCHLIGHRVASQGTGRHPRGPVPSPDTINPRFAILEILEFVAGVRTLSAADCHAARWIGGLCICPQGWRSRLSSRSTQCGHAMHRMTPTRARIIPQHRNPRFAIFGILEFVACVRTLSFLSPRFKTTRKTMSADCHAARWIGGLCAQGWRCRLSSRNTPCVFAMHQMTPTRARTNLRHRNPRFAIFGIFKKFRLCAHALGG